MDIHQLIAIIKAGPNDITLYDGATESLIEDFEAQMGLKLPADLKMFYQSCNGFESRNSMLRIIPLDEILDEKRLYPENELCPNQFYLAEHLIYSDTWTIEIDSKQDKAYLIFYLTKENKKLELTHSLAEFICHCLAGGVFGEQGLYKWVSELEASSQPTSAEDSQPT